MNSKSDAIFVQIPSYRDNQLIHTIDDMLAKSFNKERLNIVVCWQHAKSERLPRRILRKRNIKIIDVDYKISKGANWARSIIQTHWNNEPYTLLMDSHLRFVKNWDKKLIEMLEGVKKKDLLKPIISGFPPSFNDPDKFPKSRMNYPIKMYPKKHEGNLLIKFYGLPIPFYSWLKEPIPADFLAMGFLFADGYFNEEINFDPNIYFFGDDITTTLRAFCHGYNFYHPHRIIVWHLYNRDSRIPHWEDHEDWKRLEKKSINRITCVLKGKEIKKYTLGNYRTIDEYEKYIGMKLIDSI
jgi:hypothetical protein